MHPQTNPTYIFIKLQPEKDNYNVPIILHTNVKQLPSPLTFPFEMWKQIHYLLFVELHVSLFLSLPPY